MVLYYTAIIQPLYSLRNREALRMASFAMCCAGLGGPMGLLLAQPITNALKEALATSAALSEVRRILELIVPLAYRPPIKVCTLPLCSS